MGKLKSLWKAICEAFNIYSAYSILSTLGGAGLIAGLLIAFVDNLAKAPIFAQILLVIGILCFSLVGVSLVGAWAWKYFKWSPRENLKITESNQTTEQIQSAIFATKEELGGSYLKDRHIRISDLAGLLRDRTFQNCYIYGPAIVFFHDETVMAHCNWKSEATIEDLFYETKPDRRAYVGVIPIGRCNFHGCTFIGIGVVGPPLLIETIRAGIKVSPAVTKK